MLSMCQACVRTLGLYSRWNPHWSLLSWSYREEMEETNCFQINRQIKWKFHLWHVLCMGDILVLKEFLTGHLTWWGNLRNALGGKMFKLISLWWLRLKGDGKMFQPKGTACAKALWRGWCLQIIFRMMNMLLSREWLEQVVAWLKVRLTFVFQNLDF